MSHTFYNCSEAVRERYWNNPLSAIYRPVSSMHINGYVEQQTINEVKFYLSIESRANMASMGKIAYSEIIALIDG